MMSYMAQALLILLRNTSYERITVSAITKKAGVDRSTYYRRFETKDAVVRYIYDQIMMECQEAYLLKDTTDYRVYIQTRFETLYAHREELLCLHRAGLSHLLFGVLTERYLRRMGTENDPVKEQFRISYHLGGIYNNVLLWLSHGMAESPEQMTEIAMGYRPEEAVELWMKRP